MNGPTPATLERDAVRFSWAASTDVGKVRRVNEDSVLSIPGLWLVADGMGGHAAGDVASSTVCSVFERAGDEVPLPLARIEELVGSANSQVHAAAVAGGGSPMGTTVVGLVLVDNGGDDGLVVMNVGDSRCYAFDASTGLRQLTTDHSVVQELVEAGTITTEEAATHPDRNVVTRAIGIEAAVAADFTVPRIEHRTRLLLCSDGVSGPLGDAELSQLLADAPSPAHAVEAILDAVLRGSASDNATALVVDIEPLAPTTGPDLGMDDDITGPRPRREPDDITGPRPERVGRTTLIDAVPIGTPIEQPLPPPTTDQTPISEVPS